MSVLAAGCALGEGGGGPDAADGATRWELSPEPVLRIGSVDGPPEEQFAGVRGVVRLSDGSIAVAEASTQDIRVFDASGGFVHTLGRSGNGPGEFSDIWRLYLGPGDTIWGFDQPKALLVGFADGEYVRDLPLGERTGREWPEGWTESGVLVRRGLPVDRQVWVPGTLAPRRAQVFMVSAEGEASDSLTTLEYSGAYLRNDESASTRPPLLQGAAFYATGPDRLYLAANTSPYFLVFSREGGLIDTLLIPEIAGDERARLLEARKEAELARADPGSRDATARELEAMPNPEVYTDIARLRVGADGGVWVQSVPFPGDSVVTWRVLEPSGEVRARVTVPAGLQVFQTGPDFILGVERDELDVPYVVLYEISGSAGG